jgi:4-amino-4-deoxychorismate lyase
MDFALIETFRFDPADGFLRLGRHLQRMENSALKLGFSFDRSAIDSELAELAASGTPLRVRLELAHGGKVSATAAPFHLQGEDTVWKIALARTQLDSSDSLLAHKTTRRAIYEQARAEFPAGEVQEVLLSNHHGEICEGTITNIFICPHAGGKLLTPPASSGLLPGILRGELLEMGKAREAALQSGDLNDAAEIFVGNSLRGLIRAEFVPS